MAVLIRTSPAGGAAAPDRLRRRLRTAPGCKLAYARRCVRLFRSQPSPPSNSTGIPGRKTASPEPLRRLSLVPTQSHARPFPAGAAWHGCCSASSEEARTRPSLIGRSASRCWAGSCLPARRALVVQQLVSSFASPAGMVHGPLIVDQVY